MADRGEQTTAVERALAAEPPGGVEANEPESIPPNTFDGEDFLFHLYRGSELLQDNCVGEAKEELERALSMQPRDVEGQGLLGVVYFRLGLYPRAIQIYEDLISAYPGEVTPRINLALCYLKTGQSMQARDALEAVLRIVPDHRRAWGYLGLVFERMSDHAKALAAFERAGQQHMVRRMQHLLDDEAAPPDPNPPEREEMRLAAADAVRELDEPRPFSMAGPGAGAPPSRSGRWRAVEPGEERLPPSRSPVGAAPPGRFGPAVPAVPTSLPPAAASSAPAPAPALPDRPPSPSELAQSSRLWFSDGPGVVMQEGLALVRVSESFVARVAWVRALLPHGKPFASREVKRRARGRDQVEPLGGSALPLVELEGAGRLVIAAPAPLSAVAVALDRDFLYVREDRLLGFDSTLRHENGRLATGDDDPIAMVQFSGRGHLVFATHLPLRGLDVDADQPLSLRAEDVLGWTGRLLPQPLPASQAPGSTHGLVVFNGEGAVFVDPERNAPGSSRPG